MKKIFILAAVTSFAASAAAAPVIYIHEGSGSGTLDGVAFDSSFTIRALADTDNIVSFSGGLAVQHDSATIDIDGVGSFDFLIDTRTFVNNRVELIGFSRSDGGGTGGLDLFNGPFDPALGSYDLGAPFGPILGDGELLQWASTPVDTTGGVLFFDSDFTDARFTAIPAPGTASLAIIAGLAAVRRRR
ncbi:MAG: hypothetical protein ACFCBV_11405 [Phycisphaerales bacterium]